jgi:biopolymer transport protein ExbB/TolQ
MFHGAGDPKLMAGVSQALITTVLGLDRYP